MRAATGLQVVAHVDLPASPRGCCLCFLCLLRLLHFCQLCLFYGLQLFLFQAFSSILLLDLPLQVCLVLLLLHASPLCLLHVHVCPEAGELGPACDGLLHFQGCHVGVGMVGTQAAATVLSPV